MRKFLLLASLVLGCAHAASAQNAKPYPKFEFFVGYSRESFDNHHCSVGRLEDGSCVPISAVQSGAVNDPFKQRVGMNGVEASALRNFTSYFGAKLDFSAHFKTTTVETNRRGSFGFSELSITEKHDRLYQLMTGPEFKVRNSTRVTPFADLLVGAVHSSSTGRNILDEIHVDGMLISSRVGGSFSGGDTRAAAAVGGGLDVRVSGRASIRTSVDYNPTFLNQGPFSAGGGRQNNLRTSVGVLFH